MLQTFANAVVELPFESRTSRADPFNQIELNVIFTDPTGVSRRVPAFWAGGKHWKARYASPIPGVHRFRTSCTDSNDAGLHGVKGSLTVLPYAGDNPLYAHGPIQVAPDKRHFEHLDGTPFLYLADTWWMGLCQRLHWPEEFAALAADRLAKGFNAVQIVAGLYPDQPAFDPRAENEAGFAWERGYQRIRPKYFDAADRRIMYLVENGLMPCIIGAWGYHLGFLGMKKMKQHLRDIMARWGALPMIWCMAGEFNLPWYLTPGFPMEGDKQAANWEKLFKYFRSINGMGRLLSAHPTGVPPFSARLVLKDPTLLDFDMLQTGHGGGAMPTTVGTLRNSLAAKPIMPVVNAEVVYEALGGCVPPFPRELVRMTAWMSLCGGTAGHAYGGNGIWQVNRKDRPYGNSPHGITYGSIPWDEAMALPGGKETAMARTILEKYDFAHCRPHPDWAKPAGKSPDKFTLPATIGIANKLRVTYVPTDDAVVLTKIKPDIAYAATLIDPVTGSRQAIGPLAADAAGNCQVPSPGWGHDWIIALDARP